MSSLLLRPLVLELVHQLNFPEAFNYDEIFSTWIFLKQHFEMKLS